MTPKEKALQLITRFQHPLSEESDTDCLHIEVAKEFALLSVDEIMVAIDGFLEARIFASGYWIEVKKELYKLS
jgi:hypothetical protein